MYIYYFLIVLVCKFKLCFIFKFWLLSFVGMAIPYNLINIYPDGKVCCRHGYGLSQACSVVHYMDLVAFFVSLIIQLQYIIRFES